MNDQQDSNQKSDSSDQGFDNEYEAWLDQLNQQMLLNELNDLNLKEKGG